MKYIVVKTNKLAVLIELVNKNLSEGWTLQGGVSVSESSDQGHEFNVYAQAMVKVG